MKQTKLVLMAMLPIVLLMSARVLAADASKVKQKAHETADAAGDYANQTKEDFQKNMQAQLDAMTVQMRALKAKAAKASGHVQDSLDEQIADLDVQRMKIKRKLGDTSKSTGAAWEEMKSGITKAMDDLKTGYNKAKETASGEPAHAELTR